jgi:release factor glutamine methyltransferase
VIDSLPLLITEKAKVLEDVGIDQGRAEIEIVLCHLLKCDRMNLFLSGALLINDDLLSRLDNIVKRRATRYPLQYILEESWFYGRRFFVSPAVMIPTPETELLCETAIRFVKKADLKKPRILDLGVGSGVISVTIAKELADCQIVAVDISPDAIEVAKRNARDLGTADKIEGTADKIEFRQSDLFTAVTSDEKFDLILSNPPYISDEEYKTLPPEVLADPKVALTSGEEGLDAVKLILRDAPNYLTGGGRLMFEIGYNQAEWVQQLTETDDRYRSIVILKDLNDIDRVVLLACED